MLLPLSPLALFVAEVRLTTAIALRRGAAELCLGLSTMPAAVHHALATGRLLVIGGYSPWREAARHSILVVVQGSQELYLARITEAIVVPGHLETVATRNLPSRRKSLLSPSLLGSDLWYQFAKV